MTLKAMQDCENGDVSTEIVVVGRQNRSRSSGRFAQLRSFEVNKRSFYTFVHLSFLSIPFPIVASLKNIFGAAALP
jgi:hypothetical protein